MQQIMSGETPEITMTAFMVALRTKGESVDELSGLVDVALEHSLKLSTGPNAVDIVGTGGDMLGTVNISSMASVVTASVGVPVLKHGSRSASGKTGSAEMLEALGVRLDASPERLAEIFEQVGITFFFAPVFHPSLRYLAPVRKALGVPTTFNFLGPLANPAQPIATSLGVARASVVSLIAGELAARGRTALVFRGSDGLDELTTTGESQILQVCGGEVTTFELNPTSFGLKKAEISQLIGGNAEENAEVARQLFAGNTAGNLGAVRDIVLLNAAGGVVAYELAKDHSRADVVLNLRFEDALQRVTAALESGATAEKLSQWISASEN
mgnify:CR=1 FL=1